MILRQIKERPLNEFKFKFPFHYCLVFNVADVVRTHFVGISDGCFCNSDPVPAAADDGTLGISNRSR